MSLLQQQNFLARLYTDENLRKNFLSEPEKVGRENDLSEREIADISQIIPEELNFFADSLFRKRLHEVEKMLPLTREFLGKDFENYFRRFSQNFHPSSVKKHLEDAIEFVNFIAEAEIKDVWVKDSAKFEQAKLEFTGRGKNFVVRVFDFNVKEFQLNGAGKRGFQIKRKKTIAVWLRIGNRVKHYIV